MKASDLFARCLENEEVEYVFGLPGEELKDLVFSLKDSSINFVVVRHEQGAAFMADVYGRIKGKAGVCVSTLGPGATNLVTGVADANLDHSPLVAITAQGSIERLHKDSHQIIDVVEMFKPITKWNARISAPNTIPEATRKAFKVAEAEKPGATHLELPEDIASQEAAEGKPLRREKIRRPAPDWKALKNAVDLINESEKPLILAGNGAIRKLASNQLRLFVEKTGIPVVSTFMGKGAVSDAETTSLMSIGFGAQKQVYEVIEASDLIITIGYDIAELDPRAWNKSNKRVVHVDFYPAEVYAYYQPEVEVVADISNTLWNFNQAINKRFVFPEAQEYRLHLQKSVLEFSSDGFPVHPKHALLQLRRVLGNDSVVISDVGAHKMWIGAAFPTYSRGSVVFSNSFASMGIALPGAIGAKLASPDSQIVAVCGDGGFLMNVQELETAVRLGIDFTVVVFSDSSYSLIETKFLAEEKSSFATDFTNPDFELLSKSFGCKYFKVEKANELQSVYEQALSERGVRIVEVPVDKSKNLELFS